MQCKSLEAIGEIHVRTEKHTEAVDIPSSLLKKSFKSGDKQMMGSAYGALGQTRHSMKRFQDSVSAQTKALKIFSANPPSSIVTKSRGKGC